MKLYNKYFASNYEELITYYPRYYKEVLEMDAILRIHGGIADSLEAGIEQIYNDCFIDEADEATIRRLEVFLGIALNKSQSLDERRKLVKSYFVGFGKVSATMLKEMIGTYTDAEVDIWFEPADEWGNNRLYIKIYRSEDDTIYMRDIMALIAKRIPAHIWYLVINDIMLEIEEREQEQVILKNIRFKLPISFWALRTYNGSSRYDGQYLYDAHRRYGMRIGLKEGGFQVETGQEADLRRVRFRWEQRGQETADAGLQGIGIPIPEESESRAALRLRTGCEWGGMDEEISITTKTRDYWLYDGAHTYDGSRAYDSIFRKETVE